jgi:hypothetical protein
MKMSEPHENQNTGDTTRAETDKPQQRLTPAMVAAIAARVQGDQSVTNAHENQNDAAAAADVVSDEFEPSANEDSIETIQSTNLPSASSTPSHTKSSVTPDTDDENTTSSGMPIEPNAVSAGPDDMEANPPAAENLASDPLHDIVSDDCDLGHGPEVTDGSVDDVSQSQIEFERMEAEDDGRSGDERDAIDAALLATDRAEYVRRAAARMRAAPARAQVLGLSEIPLAELEYLRANFHDDIPAALKDYFGIELKRKEAFSEHLSRRRSAEKVE